MAATITSFLGKEIKAYTMPQENQWTIVPDSILKVNKEELSLIKEIVVLESKEFNSKYACIKLSTGYVNFTLDVRIKCEVGDHLIPESIMVYQLTNGEKTITRLAGRVM